MYLKNKQAWKYKNQESRDFLKRSSIFGKEHNETLGIKNSHSMHRLTFSILDINGDFYGLKDLKELLKM